MVLTLHVKHEDIFTRDQECRTPAPLNLMQKREKLARIAEELARRPFHGKTMGLKSNLKPVTNHFTGPKKEFEGKWCASFVYHCCRLAGFDLPPRYPLPKMGSFAGVRAWLQWAKLPNHRFYHSAHSAQFSPARGDIVVYDNLFDPGPHDHMGIILNVSGGQIRVAEGNVNNLSAIVTRNLNRHIRGYIRIPDGYKHRQ